MKAMKNLIPVILLASVVVGCDDTLRMASDGRSDYAIVVEADAADIVKFAAWDLGRVLNQIAGAEFPLCDPKDPSLSGKKRIEVGTRRGKTMVGEGHLSGLGHNGSISASVGDDIVLVGRDDWGSAGAVYDFLQKQLGCRWWTPAGDESVPRRRELSVAPFKAIVKNPLECRWLITLPALTDARRNGNLFMIRNGYNINGESSFPNLDLPPGMKPLEPETFPATRMVHSLFTFIPPHDARDYFGKHPEWFTFRKEAGKRVDNRQLCFSNPALRREFKKNFFAEVEKRKGRGIYNISAMDISGAFCECSECAKMIAEYECDGAPINDFICEVASELKARYPEAILDILAYHKDQSQQPPNAKFPGFPGNVVLTFAPIDDDLSKNISHPNNRETLKDLIAWKKLISRIWVWYYPQPYPLMRAGQPYSGVRRSAEDLRIMIENGLTGAKFEHDIARDFGSGFYDLMCWVWGRLFREPDLDVEKLVREFCDGYYGLAADEVWAYWDELERLREEYDRFEPFNRSPVELYTGERVFQWTKMLEAAEKKVAGDAEILQRVREVRIGLDAMVLENYVRLRRSYPERLEPLDTLYGRLTNSCTRAFARRGRTVTGKDSSLARNAVFGMFEDYRKAASARGLKPAELAKVPDERIVYVLPGIAVMEDRREVADPDAAFGRAYVEDLESVSTNAYFSCNLYDTDDKTYLAKRRILASEMTEGVYKAYRIGRFRMSPKCGLFLGSSWRMSRRLWEFYQPGAVDEYELYISMKFEGPKYFPGSKRGNRALFAQAILVRTN